MLPYSTRCPGSIIGQFCAPEGAAECGVAVLRTVRCWSGRSWLRWRVSMWRRRASRGLTGLRVGRLVSWQRLFLHYFRCRSMLRQARGARRRCQHGPRCRLQRQWPLWRAASPDRKALLLVRRGVREVMLLPVPFARLSCAASAQRCWGRLHRPDGDFSFAFYMADNCAPCPANGGGSETIRGASCGDNSQTTACCSP